MTNDEIMHQMRNVRGTLMKDQALLLELLNHVMGCAGLLEKLTAELAALEAAENESEE